MSEADRLIGGMANLPWRNPKFREAERRAYDVNRFLEVCDEADKKGHPLTDQQKSLRAMLQGKKS